MLTSNVLAVFDSLRPRHLVLLKKYMLLAQMYAFNVVYKREMPVLDEARDEALLQSLLAFYDRSTIAHALRIVVLAEGLACQLCLADEEVLQVCRAALLHDIGKAAIPRAILEKRGPLSEREWRVMRRHPEIGQRMLLRAGEPFARLAPVVVAHHENWDSGGYPAQLGGEEIPLAARIIAVADSYDAMTHRRVYREPQTNSEACAELQRCAGSQFDPRIVDAFLLMLSEAREHNEQRARRSLASGDTESADAVFVKPSPRSDECVRASA